MQIIHFWLMLCAFAAAAGCLLPGQPAGEAAQWVSEGLRRVWFGQNAKRRMLPRPGCWC
jgi:hypothetical protein